MRKMGLLFGAEHQICGNEKMMVKTTLVLVTTLYGQFYQVYQLLFL